MYKIVVFLALICVALAGLIASPAAIVYDASPEYPSASGYEYQHTVQTPDYVSHASVSAPLNGFAEVPSLVRSIYTQPPVAYTYAQQAW